jgi:hypothetical protein
MADKCPKCSAEVDLAHRHCTVCETDAGFPNVRMASREDERASLAARMERARVSSAACDMSNELEAFVAAVSTSSAVMNRSFGALQNWLLGGSPLFQTFHRQVEHSGRPIDESGWDQQRVMAEGAINPYCYRDLSFAALTLDYSGMDYYGPYAVILRDELIESRASVFEENPFFFVRNHHVTPLKPLPVGYRAAWSDRGLLAAAKLHSQLKLGMEASQFAAVLMEPRRGDSDCDFVEVHIYGPVNRAAIAAVTGPVPADHVDRLLWKKMKRVLADLSASVLETA